MDKLTSAVPMGISVELAELGTWYVRIVVSRYPHLLTLRSIWLCSPNDIGHQFF